MKNITYFKKLSLALVMLVGFTNFVNAQIPSYVPTNGLVGYWPFSGNANDISINANNGTNNGATLTTDRFGNANSAYSFNGSSNYVNVNSSSSLNTANMNKLSISGWFNNVSAGSGSGGFVVRLGNQNLTTGGIGYEVFTNNGSLYVNNWWLNQNPHYSDSKVIQNNQWNFFVIVYNFDNNISSFYVNGILVNSTTATLYKSTNPILNIGRNTNIGSYFNGLIDDIGIWNRALTIDEITNLYNANLCYQSSFIINTGILSYNPPTYNNTITIYPNPANDHITIDCGAIANVVGYRIEIANSLGQVVFNKPMNTQQYTVALNSWSGQGIYFVNVYDASNTLLTTRKLILQ